MHPTFALVLFWNNGMLLLTSGILVSFIVNDYPRLSAIIAPQIANLLRSGYHLKDGAIF